VKKTILYIETCDLTLQQGFYGNLQKRRGREVHEANKMGETKKMDLEQ
jgi:hypothetical protein